MKNIIIIILSLSLFLWGCKKEPITDPPQTLPEATQIGANTFGCKVNGTICSSSGYYEKPDPFTSAGYYVRIRYILWDSTQTILDCAAKYNFGIDLNFSNDNLIGNKNINSLELYYKSKSYTVKSHNSNYFKLSRNDSKIKSGEFEFYALNQIDSTDILHITEGRFDIREP